MLAYDYPLLGLFWTMLWFSLWAAWLVLLFRVIGDILRSDDMGAFAKALWLLAVILVPFAGVLIYVIARGAQMGQRDVQHARAQEQALQAYVRDVAGTTGTAEELAQLVDLRDRGVMTDDEFETQKHKTLTKA